jgi:hypothetical protein
MNMPSFHTPSKRLLGLCAVIIVIAAVGVAAYEVTNRPTPKPRAISLSTQTSIQSIVSSLRSSLLAEYTYLYGGASDAQMSIGYQLPGDTFQVLLPAMSPSLSFNDTDGGDEQTTYSDLSRVAGAINSDLIRHGFVSVPGQDQTSGLLSSTYFYKRSNAVCRVLVYTQLDLTCAPMARLKTAAAQAKPLVALYVQAAPDSGTALIAMPNIRPSETSGYELATLSIYNNHGETSANFYKQGTGTWQMVPLGWYNDPHEDANITPNCADFESSAQIGAAFAGQTCYDSAANTMSTIHG